MSASFAALLYLVSGALFIMALGAIAILLAFGVLGDQATFDADPDAWVAIITGVGDAFFTGADLKTYVPAITALGKRIQAEGLTEVDGYRLDDGTRALTAEVPAAWRGRWSPT